MSGKVPGESRASTARALRKLRARRVARRMLLGIGLPTLLAAIYYGAIATPEYESVTAFTIQSADGGAGVGGLELLIASVPSSAGRDVMMVREYIESRDILARLTSEHGFVEHYGAPTVDYLSRLPQDATTEELYSYFREKVRVEHDTHSGTLTLRVKAFSADKAEELATAVLEASERMVNEMTAQARRDRTELARQELERAEERLTKARQAFVEMQREGAILDPAASAEAIITVRSRLEADLAAARAELSSLRATLQPGAPQLRQAQARVAGLAQQLERQERQMVGDDHSLRESIARFEPVAAEKEFAERAYRSALTSLEVARVEADRQHRYLVTIARPSHPDAPTHPRFWHSVLTVLVLSFAALGIGTLLLASIREHANV